MPNWLQRQAVVRGVSGGLMVVADEKWREEVLWEEVVRGVVGGDGVGSGGRRWCGCSAGSGGWWRWCQTGCRSRM